MATLCDHLSLYSNSLFSQLQVANNSNSSDLLYIVTKEWHLLYSTAFHTSKHAPIDNLHKTKFLFRYGKKSITTTCTDILKLVKRAATFGYKKL